MVLTRLGVDSSLNTEEDAVEPSTDAEQPGEAEEICSGNGTRSRQV